MISNYSDTPERTTGRCEEADVSSLLVDSSVMPFVHVEHPHEAQHNCCPGQLKRANTQANKNENYGPSTTTTTTTITEG